MMRAFLVLAGAVIVGAVWLVSATSLFDDCDDSAIDYSRLVQSIEACRNDPGCRVPFDAYAKLRRAEESMTAACRR